MSGRLTATNEAPLGELVTHVHQRLPPDQAALVEEFARQYYHRSAPEDLLELETEDLYGAVLAHWRLAQRRQPGEAKVRVYSPRFEEHGWRSKHSIDASPGQGAGQLGVMTTPRSTATGTSHHGGAP
jgi:NAD-specific glutamate dehydrogenase